jgi:hypothetical protein
MCRSVSAAFLSLFSSSKVSIRLSRRATLSRRFFLWSTTMSDSACSWSTQREPLAKHSEQTTGLSGENKHRIFLLRPECTMLARIDSLGSSFAKWPNSDVIISPARQSQHGRRMHPTREINIGTRLTFKATMCPFSHSLANPAVSDCPWQRRQVPMANHIDCGPIFVSSVKKRPILRSNVPIPQKFKDESSCRREYFKYEYSSPSTRQVVKNSIQIPQMARIEMQTKTTTSCDGNCSVNTRPP